MEKQKRKLAFKKELVLQKHLAHEVKSWDQLQKLDKKIQHKKNLNLILNE